MHNVYNLTCKYRHPSSGETPQEKWSSRLKNWKWFQFNLKIPSLMASVDKFWSTQNHMIIITACLQERKRPWALASPSSSMKPYQWSVHADDQILVSMFLWGHFAPELWLCCLWIVPSSQYINKSTFGIGEPCVTLQARVASSPDSTLTCGEGRLMCIEIVENQELKIAKRDKET